MSDLVVSTAYGKVRGLRKDGVAQWRGIPYAEPPVGPLRFRPPRPPVPWSGERDATRFGAVAEQSRDPRSAMLSGFTDKIAMSEDCLVLNVLSPAADDARRPVLVWIHGGAFVMGSGSQPLYNGSSFVTRHDLVVVTFNYRLGLLGLLHLGDLAPADQGYRGNVTLLDQIAALRWVRENIAAFGGDPARVTVMGESAGAIAIGTLLGAPAAKGLFDRAILQSGASGLRPHDRADATAFARSVLAELGIGEERLADGLAGALADVPIERLIAVQERLLGTRGIGAFTPFVDGELLPRSPTDAVQDGQGVHVPTLIGSNRDEWTLFDVLLGPAALEASKAHLIDRLGDDAARIHAAYQAAYQRAIAAQTPAVGAARTRPPDTAAWIDLLGDVGLRVPALRLAEAQARHAPVWMYRFDWESPAFGGRFGATHALELPFVWNQLGLPIASFLLGPDAAGARELALQLHDAWAAFIRGGEPAAAGLPAWPRFEPPRRATMLIDRQSRVADDPDAEVRARWSEVAPAAP
ncbi:MAG TPA: carboxylesterase family protein [Kofleriaceae bacterium]|nr:carboxylesterase family protein [Kofleriaceae bacterium]